MAGLITIFVAKKIVTLNPAQPDVTHVAVRDGFILEAGSLDECAAWGPYTLDDRYANAVLIPGLIESHGHQSEGQNWDYPYVGAIERFGPDGKRRPALRSVAAVVAALQPIERSMADPNQTLVAWNADPSFYSTPAPITCHDLDQVSATRPIIVTNASGHILYANSKVLAMANYAGNHVPGVMRDANGQLTGELQETAAMVPAIMAAAPQLLGAKPSPAHFWNYGRVCAMRGVTTVNDGGLGAYYDPQFYAVAACATADPAFPVRIVAHHNGITVTKAEEVLAHVAALEGKGNDKLIFQAVKFTADGSIQGFTARLRPPYYYKTGTNGLWNRSPAELTALVGTMHTAGYQVACHCNGDQAAEAFIDAVAAAQAAKPRFDHRHFIVHGQMLDEALLRRMAALGIGATMFANHLYYWGDFHYRETVGPSRSQGFSPLATALRLGVEVSTHSDTPVSPIDPLFSAWCAANRVTSAGRVLGAEERVSVLDALKLVTINAAWLLHRDHEIGSIQVGKRADFTVLGADPLAVAAAELKDVPVLGTVLGGAARRFVMDKATIPVTIPVTVIGGYLGSGKTTLLNALLRGNHGRRLAVLVNDFGSINIDANLITAHGGDTISLANGCICCSLQDNLGATLYDLATRSDPPDQIVIEASGVADPSRIGHYARSLARLHLDAVIVTADAEGIRRQARDKYVGDIVLQQLAAADLLVLTKTDLLAPETVQEVRQWLETQAPGVPVVEVVGGETPPAIILGLPGQRMRLVAEQEPPDHMPGDELHDHRFVQVTYTAEGPLVRAALAAAMDALPPGVVRAKGTFYLADVPGEQVILQVAGRRLEWQTGAPWGDARPYSRLVLIGPRALVDEESLRAGLSVLLTPTRPIE